MEEYDDMYHINGFHYPAIPVITGGQPHTWQSFKWGLIPSWVKSKEEAMKIRGMTMNARSDSLYTKPSYRQAISEGRRCLILADGFFEWHKHNKKSYPYYITMKSKNVFCMAGIWEEWIEKTTGEIYKTFSLVTCEANPLLRRIHNDGERMPVILPVEYEMKWLDRNLTKAEVLGLTVPFPDDAMVAHTISKVISERGVNTNVQAIQAPHKYQELEQPTLF